MHFANDLSRIWEQCLNSAVVGSLVQRNMHIQSLLASLSTVIIISS